MNRIPIVPAVPLALVASALGCGSVVLVEGADRSASSTTVSTSSRGGGAVKITVLLSNCLP